MPGTTAVLGIPIPLDTDPFADGAKALRDAMNNLDGRLKWGVKAVSTVASTTGTAVVTFPAAFATVPTAMVATADSGAFNVAITALSTTQATITIRHIDGAATSTTVNVYWVALR